MKGENSESDRAQVAGGYEEAIIYNKAVGIGYMHYADPSWGGDFRFLVQIALLL